MKFRLCPEDREQYPADDEWHSFTVDRLADQPASFLEHFEKTTGYTIPQLGRELENQRTHAIRAAFWAGRRMAGVDEDWATFDVKVWKVEQDDEAEDAGPLGSPPPKKRGGRSRTQQTSSASSGRSSRTSSTPSPNTSDGGPGGS